MIYIGIPSSALSTFLKMNERNIRRWICFSDPTRQSCFFYYFFFTGDNITKSIKRHSFVFFRSFFSFLPRRSRIPPARHSLISYREEWRRRKQRLRLILRLRLETRERLSPQLDSKKSSSPSSIYLCRGISLSKKQRGIGRRRTVTSGISL